MNGRDEGYDVLQVCPNGHVATEFFHRRPEYRREHCPRCGEATITACPKCQKDIRGGLWPHGAMVIGEFEPEKYCEHCGEPFPWTERAILSAVELSIEAGELSEDEAKQVGENLTAVIRQSSSAQLGAVRLKKLMAKAGPMAGKLVYDVSKDLISETFKKMIWPG